MTEERAITRKRKRPPGTTFADPHSQPRIEIPPLSSHPSSPRPLRRLTHQRPGKNALELARSESPDPIANLYDEHSRTVSPEPISPAITALGPANSSLTTAASSDLDELLSSETGPVESESDPMTIEQLLRRLTGKVNLNTTRSRNGSKRRRRSGPEPHRSHEVSSVNRRKGKNANSRPVGFSNRLLMAAATSGVELADDAPCLPSDGRKPLPFRRVEVDNALRSSGPPLKESRRPVRPAAIAQSGPSRKKAPCKPNNKPKPLNLVPLEPPTAERKNKSGNRR